MIFEKKIIFIIVIAFIVNYFVSLYTSAYMNDKFIPRSLFVADFNLDGPVDIIISTSDQIIWLENDGYENFKTNLITDDFGASAIYAYDLDNDMDLDLLVSSGGSIYVSWLENDGNMNFMFHSILSRPSTNRSIYPIDFDEDGDIDLVSASFFDNIIYWHENDGTQDFISHVVYSCADGAEDVFAKDIDKDGDMDILSASFVDRKISFHENLGDGQFYSNYLTTNSMGTCVKVADIDNDGDWDVFGTLYSDIIWFEHHGSGFFIEKIIPCSCELISNICIEDFNQDGLLDIVSDSGDDPRIILLLNDCNQNFTEVTVSKEVIGTALVYAIDFDLDGDIDIISSSLYEGTIIFHENVGNLNFNNNLINVMLK